MTGVSVQLMPALLLLPACHSALPAHEHRNSCLQAADKNAAAKLSTHQNHVTCMHLCSLVLLYKLWSQLVRSTGCMYTA